MLIALLAPEALLYLALTERIGVGYLVKEATKLHSCLAMPGMFARWYGSPWALGSGAS